MIRAPAQVVALIGGTLDVATDPQRLFDVPLSDEGAVQLERARTRVLLRAAADGAAAPPGGGRVSGRVHDASTPVELGSVEADRWQARLSLDRARLAFYELPREGRAALLTAHSARREAARPRETPVERRAPARRLRPGRTLGGRARGP